MSLSLRDLILAHVPEDGSAIGNMVLLALLREQVPGLSDEEYAAAKDDLVAEGLLGKGRGRGGSVFLAGVEDDEDGEDDGERVDGDGLAHEKRLEDVAFELLDADDDGEHDDRGDRSVGDERDDDGDGQGALHGGSRGGHGSSVRRGRGPRPR